MPLELGVFLHSRYRLRRVLAQGGQGAVYLAADENDGGRPCVVKETVGLPPEAERQFRREAGMLAGLRHPNLPRLSDHFAFEGAQYLVMDYVEGEDLAQRLTRAGRLPEADVLRWAAPLCEAVRYLHSLVPPILHRDVRPANLKLAASGALVLVDIGLARPVAPGSSAGFAPPELHGMGRADPRSDQYAVAATLYALLVGHPPPGSVERLLGKERLIPPREARPEISERTHNALLRALEIKPEDRFADVLAFTRALLGTQPAAPGAEMTVVAPARRPEPTAEKTVAPQRPAPPAADATRVGQPAAQAPPPPPPPQEPPAAPPAARRPAPQQPTIAIAVPPRPVRPVAPPRSRGPLYLVLGLVLVVLAIGAVVLGSVGGLYLSGRLGLPASATPPATATLAGPASATVPAVALGPSATPTDTPVPTDTPAPPTATETPAPTATPTLAGTPVGSGGRLAFISNRDGQHYQVYTMNPNGSDVRQVTTDPTDKWDPAWTFGGTQLAWSSDGTRLLYVAAGPNGDGTDLFMIDADGGEPVNLTSAPGDDFHPAWCGQDSLWFTSLRANNTHQIFTFTLAEALAGRRPTNISGTHNFPREYDPVPILEGGCQRVMFVTTVRGRPEIWRYFLDCPNCYRVIRTESDLNGAALDPALSSDGVHIAYTRRLEGSDQIVVGEALNRLVNVQLTEAGLNSQPQFSPDGQWLVFTSERDGNREIYLMARDGSGQANLSLDPATDTDPAWQPVAVP